MLGDLNDIVHEEERVGPPLQNTQRLEQVLFNAINYCELIDAEYSGDPFTWEQGGTQKCLDRLLVNLPWRIRFSEVKNLHLLFFKSNHRPFN